MIKKNLLIVLSLIFISLFLTACWNRVELTNRAIVSAVGIDKAEEEGKIKLTVQLIVPEKIGGENNSTENSDKAVWVVSSTGYTMFEAIRNFTMQTTRKLFWLHNRVFIISEEVAKEGIYPYLDFNIRDHEGRARTSMLVSKGKASEILEAEIELERIPAHGIEGLLDVRAATSQAVEVNMHQFLLNLVSETTSPVASRIELIESEAENENSNSLRLTGASVFEDDRFKGWLNRPETRGFSWITGEVDSGILVVEAPKDRKNVSLEIIRASSNLKARMEDGQLIIDIQVSEEGIMGDQASKKDLTTPEMIASLERRKATVIRNEIKQVLDKAQREYKADIFGFAKAVKDEFPDRWEKIEEDWERILAELEVNIDVETKIKRPQMIDKAIWKE